MRVLDLCIHRQWHDALDLLHQNGFTQYEWYELVWFHDHAPTNPPNMECGGSTPLSIPASEISNAKCQISPSPVPPSAELDSPASSIEQPASAPLTLTPEPGDIVNRKSKIENPPETLTPGPNLNASTPRASVLSASSVLKSTRPRSKIARLPKEIQDNLNTMLARGCRYNHVIRYLNDQGYAGFNKVNLHNWRMMIARSGSSERCT